MEDRPIKFAKGPFHAELRKRVDAYIAPLPGEGRDDPRMFVKAVVILSWFATSWALLVFWAHSWPVALALSASLGFATAGIGFNLMHDGSHGAFSRFPIVNRVMALSLELLGGSSFIWRWKHNVNHHSFPNILGIDHDLEVGPWARMAPHQASKPFHRFQQFYMWGLFGLLPFKWYMLDISNYRKNTVGAQKLPPRELPEKLVFLSGKIIMPLWALAIPMLFHNPAIVLLFYFTSFFVTGVVMSTTFLLAHCVDEAQVAQPINGRLDTEWAAHQIETAVDFAQGSRLACWFMGGLNFQIEHHLFPQISHVHYPKIAPIVREVCAKYGVRYTARPTVLGAIAAHFRWLERMGRGEPAMLSAVTRRAA